MVSLCLVIVCFYYMLLLRLGTPFGSLFGQFFIFKKTKIRSFHPFSTPLRKPLTGSATEFKLGNMEHCKENNNIQQSVLHNISFRISTYKRIIIVSAVPPFFYRTHLNRREER